MKLYKFMCAREIRALHKIVCEAIDEAENHIINSESASEFWYFQGRIKTLTEIDEILSKYMISEE